jgi:membrane-associated protein
MYNIVGAVLWCALFIYGGYFFGNLPIVKNNFSIVIVVIIIISVLPGVIEFARHKFANKNK